MSNKKIVTFKIYGKCIFIFTWGSINRFQFPFEICQVENFGDVLVVMLQVPTGIIYNENVFGVSSNGKILWQIEKLKYVYPDSPFTGMDNLGDRAMLLNWDGTDLFVNPNTGEILEKGYSK